MHLVLKLQIYCNYSDLYTKEIPNIGKAQVSTHYFQLEPLKSYSNTVYMPKNI